MKKLPAFWWCFLPVWLSLPAFFGAILLVTRVNSWVGFFASCIYVLLTLLTYIPMRRNRLSIAQTLLWMGFGMLLLGLPGVFLIYAIFASN